MSKVKSLPKTKRFLGYTLEKDPNIDMWFNEGGPGEVSISLNKHSDEAWSISISIFFGGTTLTGNGKTERAARDDLIKRMKGMNNLLSHFEV